MEIRFPEESTPEGRVEEALNAMLFMLNGDDIIVSKIQKFPLILAWHDTGFRYVGRIILAKGKNLKPVALAREAYGRHVVNMLFGEAANQVNKQIIWLSDNADRIFPDEKFKVVILFAPDRGDLRLALSEEKLINVKHVVDYPRNRFDLINIADYGNELFQYRQERLQRIADNQTEDSDFGGLPA